MPPWAAKPWHTGHRCLFRGPEECANFDDPLLSNLRFAQAKHHRWYLDRGQIVNYQLGGYFPALQGCWERIELPPRTLNFVTLNAMTWTVLVCEDLARQDPAADLIRAVGPNLLIALLMDGPAVSADLEVGKTGVTEHGYRALARCGCGRDPDRVGPGRRCLCPQPRKPDAHRVLCRWPKRWRPNALSDVCRVPIFWDWRIVEGWSWGLYSKAWRALYDGRY